MEQVRGVGLFLTNNQGLFYAIEERVMKKSADQKNPGDLSIPLETLEADEGHVEAVERLFTEEVDDAGIIEVTKPLYLGEYVLRENSRITTVFLYFSEVLKWNGMPFAGSHAGSEYTPYGFISKKELLLKGRNVIPDLFALWDLYMGLEV